MCAAKNADKNPDEKRTMGIKVTEDQINGETLLLPRRPVHHMVRSFGGQRVAGQKDRERSANPLTSPAKRGA